MLLPFYSHHSNRTHSLFNLSCKVQLHHALQHDVHRRLYVPQKQPHGGAFRHPQQGLPGRAVLGEDGRVSRPRIAALLGVEVLGRLCVRAGVRLRGVPSAGRVHVFLLKKCEYPGGHLRRDAGLREEQVDRGGEREEGADGRVHVVAVDAGGGQRARG